MTRLPPGWKLVKLEDVTSPAREAVVPQEGEQRPYLGLEHVEPQTTRIREYGDTSKIRSTAIRFEPGDTLYARLRPYLNKVVHAELEGLASAEFIVLKPSPVVVPKFLMYVLNSNRFVTFANQLSEGDRPRVKWNQLASFEMPLPPLYEQRQLVAAIEQHLSHLDSADALLSRIERRLKLLRAALLRAAFAEKWPKIRIGDVARVGSGATPKRGNPEYWENGTIPWVTSGQLTQPYVREPTSWITETALRETNVKLWPKHTLLVALYGEGKTRGHCSELLIDATTNQACAAIVVDDERVSRDYLKLFFAASYEANRTLAAGAVQPNLSLGVVKNLQFPLPPLDEQQQTTHRLSQELSVIDSLELAVILAMRRGASLRRAILEAAFAGRLILQNE